MNSQTYKITTQPGRVHTADTIPAALVCLAEQMAAELPKGSVAWCITDPDGVAHRGRNDLNTRLDLLPFAVKDLVDALYVELHRAADGGVDVSWLEPAE